MKALLLSSGIVSLMTACASPPVDKEIVVYSYGAASDAKEEAIGELIRRFETNHPRFKVHPHPITTITNEQHAFYLASLGSRSTFVDLFEIDVVWTSEFAAAGLLLPLDPYLQREEGRFLPSLLQTAEYAGQRYALPFWVNFSGLFYRPSLLEKYGAALPQTLEDLISVAKNMGAKEGMYGLLWQGKQYEGGACNFFDFYFNLGGDLTIASDGSNPASVIKFDPEALRLTFTMMHNLVHGNSVSPKAVADHDEMDSIGMFKDGEAVFMRNWQDASHLLRGGDIGDDYAIAPMPGAGVALLGGFNLAINRRSNHADAAYALAEFLTREESQRYLMEKTGQASALRTVYQGNADPVLTQLAQNARSRPRSPYYLPFSALLQKVMSDLLSKKQTPDEAVAALLEGAEKLKLPTRAGVDFPEQLHRWY